MRRGRKQPVGDPIFAAEMAAASEAHAAAERARLNRPRTTVPLEDVIVHPTMRHMHVDGCLEPVTIVPYIDRVGHHVPRDVGPGWFRCRQGGNYLHRHPDGHLIGHEPGDTRSCPLAGGGRA